MLEKEQNIERLIQGIKSLKENRCSPSDEEVKLLDECVELLENIKLEFAAEKKKEFFLKAIMILLRFFKDDIHNLLN